MAQRFGIGTRVAIAAAMALKPGVAKPAGSVGTVRALDGSERYRIEFDDEPGVFFTVHDRVVTVSLAAVH